MTDLGARAGRPLCDRCTRPVAACICPWVRPVPSLAHLLILQHPMEVSNAKGSARLLHMSLTNSTLLTGERFAPDVLDSALYADGLQPLLLYPDLPGERALGIPAPPLADPALLEQPAQVRLVILDGTWRKSRKMLYLNPALHAIPRLSLDAALPSHYVIRKAHAPHQLSTLEAACHALGRLHGTSAPFAPLLAGFDAFVAQFQATGGKLATSPT